MGKQKLKDANTASTRENTASSRDKPEPGKVYALTGGPGTRCIANGNTWKDSEVKDD